MTRSRRFLSRFLAYAWAAPNTALGVLVGIAMLSLGGRFRFVAGVAEFHGGRAGRFLAGLPAPFRFGAMTLGHVILGTSKRELARFRRHEHVHVRQYERWGLFFLPAYALSSLWQVARGRPLYRHNFFERQAYAVEARKSRGIDLVSVNDARVPLNPNNELVEPLEPEDECGGRLLCSGSARTKTGSAIPPDQPAGDAAPVSRA